MAGDRAWHVHSLKLFRMPFHKDKFAYFLAYGQGTFKQLCEQYGCR